MRKVTSESQLLAHLMAAMDAQRAVTIRYEKPVENGVEVSRRRIEIHSIELTKDNNVIIRCYDHKSGSAHTFRLDRITNYTLHRPGKLGSYRMPVVPDSQLITDEFGELINVVAWDFEWKLIA